MFQTLHQLQIFVSYLLTAARMRMQRFSIHVISSG